MGACWLSMILFVGCQGLPSRSVARRSGERDGWEVHPDTDSERSPALRSSRTGAARAVKLGAAGDAVAPESNEADWAAAWLGPHSGPASRDRLERSTHAVSTMLASRGEPLCEHEPMLGPLFSIASEERSGEPVANEFAPERGTTRAASSERPLVFGGWTNRASDDATRPFTTGSLGVSPLDASAHADETGDVATPPGTSSLERHETYPPWENLGGRVVSDFTYLYTEPHTLWRMGGALAIAAVVANTQLDREISEHYRESLNESHFRELNELSAWVKPFGDGMLMLPIYTGAALLGLAADRWSVLEPVSDWGGRSLRASLVGMPALFLLQKATGGARPDEIDAGSRWIPWKDNNGVSGHAFMGAIPFLTAARMVDDPWVKGALYLGSTLTAWSRFHDFHHYGSQVALGWFLAYLAVEAVDQTEWDMPHLRVSPGFVSDGFGFLFEYKF